MSDLGENIGETSLSESQDAWRRFAWSAEPDDETFNAQYKFMDSLLRQWLAKQPKITERDPIVAIGDFHSDYTHYISFDVREGFTPATVRFLHFMLVEFPVFSECRIICLPFSDNATTPLIYHGCFRVGSARYPSDDLSWVEAIRANWG